MFLRSRSYAAALSSLVLGTVLVSAQQQGAVTPKPADAVVRAIEPPERPLPGEAESAGVTKFSFLAYGDNRASTDGVELQHDHGLVVDAMVTKIQSLASTESPVRFVIQSGDGVLNGRNGAALNVSYTPLVERLTRGAGVPFFASAGNHDVTTLPLGDPARALALGNMLAAHARLMPPDSSPRRLAGYPTYAFGYGHVFFIAIDSNIAADPAQLAWVTVQLEHLDRSRYRHVIAFFHHPPFSSGPHGGAGVEPQSRAIRDLYLPLFRRHHVRMTITGHDHLYDHFVERYDEKGRSLRRDDVVTGGGGAPIYLYKGEPDLQPYMAAAGESVRVQHLVTPGSTAEENPHHFVVVQVDGDRLTLEIVSIGPTPLTPFGGRATIELTDRIS